MRAVYLNAFSRASNRVWRDLSLGVIAVTGRADAEDARLSRANGFAAHLVKPVDLSRLGALLDEGQLPGARP